MGKPISPGDEVVCRYFNRPENKFYGDFFTAVVVEVNKRSAKPYLVRRNDSGYELWLHRREIRSRIKHVATVTLEGVE